MVKQNRLRPRYDELRRPNVLWVTNMAAPYRLPLWRSINREANLRVALLESKTSLTSDREANRGSDWVPGTGQALDFMEIRASKIKHGEARYYFPRDVKSIFLARDYDALVFGGWESPIYWFLLLSAKVLRKGCVGFYESTKASMKHKTGLIAWIRFFFFKGMDTIVVPGSAAKDALLFLGVPEEKIYEGFNSIDFESFAIRQPPLPRDGRGHSFLYVGQLIPRKRIDAIIEAFCEVGTPVDTLTILGSGSQESAIRARALVDPRIQLLPYVENSQIPQIMARHDTLVLASSEEVWGLVVNEALASGLQVVVSQNCGVVPSVQHMDGVFVAAPDLRDLGKCMADSRETWRGPIEEPAILAHTPDKFASVFLEAIEASSGGARTRVALS